MANTYRTVTTRYGQSRLADALASKTPVGLLEMALGDGAGRPTSPSQDAKRLVNEVYRANIIGVDSIDDVTVRVAMRVPSEVGGFTVREVGLYDDDGRLVAIGNYPDTYKPEPDDGSVRELLVRMWLRVSSTEQVDITVDTSIIYATKEWVQQRLDEHAASRDHPYATTTAQGMVELATFAEARDRKDNQRVLTPASGGAMLGAHEVAPTAHSAAQIALEKLLDTFGDADTVQAVLAMLGSAALKKSGDFAAAGHTHDSVENAAGDRVTISATGNLDHYVGDEYLFRVNSSGKLDRAAGGIDASLLTDKAPVSVIPHMIGADGRGWCGLVNDPNDEKYLGALRLSGAGTLYYQYEGGTKFQVTSDGRVDTYGDLTGGGNLKMTGGQWTLGNMSGDGASLHMDGSRWAYASDYRIAFNPGQAREVTTAYGNFEVRADEGVSGYLYVENNAKVDGKLIAGDNSGLGKFSVSGESMYVDSARWMYATSFRIAFNSGQQRTETTAYGRFAVDSDSGVAGEIRVDNQLVWHDGMSQKNYGANGYEILPSGLVIQWGNANVGRNNFTIPFPNNVNKLIATDQDSNLDIVNVEYVSRSQFNIYSTDNGAVYYIAIGY